MRLPQAVGGGGHPPPPTAWLDLQGAQSDQLGRFSTGSPKVVPEVICLKQPFILSVSQPVSRCTDGRQIQGQEATVEDQEVLVGHRQPPFVSVVQRPGAARPNSQSQSLTQSQARPTRDSNQQPFCCQAANKQTKSDTGLQNSWASWRVTKQAGSLST